MTKHHTIALLSALTLASAAKKTGVTTRRLENENNDISWLSQYNLMYQNCFLSENSASFRLCPADNNCQAGCSNGAEYVVDFDTFIDAFTELQLGARHYRCEMARENCDYDDEDMCYQAQNLEYCDDHNEDANGFDLQEYLQCKKIADGVYVGPYCSDNNYDIFLGVFDDEDCESPADASAFYDIMGYALPYSSSSIIEDKCARCNEHYLQEDKNGGDDAEDDDEALEQCEMLYGYYGYGCETELGLDNADEDGCEYIQELQDAEGVNAGYPSSMAISSKRKRKGWLIFLLIVLLAVLGAGIYHYLLQREKKQQAAAANAVDADNKPSEEKLVSA